MGLRYSSLSCHHDHRSRNLLQPKSLKIYSAAWGLSTNLAIGGRSGAISITSRPPQFFRSSKNCVNFSAISLICCFFSSSVMMLRQAKWRPFKISSDLMVSRIVNDNPREREGKKRQGYSRGGLPKSPNPSKKTTRAPAILRARLHSSLGLPSTRTTLLTLYLSTRLSSCPRSSYFTHRLKTFPFCECSNKSCIILSPPQLSP